MCGAHLDGLVFGGVLLRNSQQGCFFLPSNLKTGDAWLLGDISNVGTRFCECPFLKREMVAVFVGKVERGGVYAILVRNEEG